MNDQDLAPLREGIDELDRRLLDLLNQRAELVLKIGLAKADRNQWVLDPRREKEVLENLAAANPGPLTQRALNNIFGEVISACRSLQEPVRVAFLGPELSFCHQAGLNRFGRSAGFLARATIADIFGAVESGQAGWGVVPVENSTEGAVNSTLDRLVDSDLTISGELTLSVGLALISGEEDLAGVDLVASHPQALAQCRGWLSRNLPRVALVDAASTSEAARTAAGRRGMAAVGSELLARRYELNLLAQDIQDLRPNWTRFWIISRQPAAPTGDDKTSLMLATDHRPGSLQRALTPLAEAGLNLTRIESRPSRRQPWDYLFFLDLEGHREEDQVRAGLEALARQADQVKVFGSYPKGDKP